MCQNIDDFNRGAAFILARLYQAFPIPVFVRVDEIDDGVDLLAAERAARLQERAAIYAATMEFLADEGYLTYTDKVGPDSRRHYAAVRLTSKGLAVLSATPAAIQEPGKPLGDQLVGWVGEGAKEAMRHAVRLVMAAAVCA